MPTGEGRSFSVVGDIYTFKAVGEDTGGAYSLFEFFIPPQSGSPPHIHNREDETFYILEGELSFQLGDQKIVLPPGSFVHAPKGIPHCFKNEGTTPVKTLTSVVPAGIEKFFEEVGYPVTDKDTPVPVTPADQIKKMLEVAPKYGMEILPPSAMKTVNQGTSKVNYASRDRNGEVVFYVLLWKRKGIALNMFDDYWRNVHGPVCARLPGQHQYWQFHLAHNQGGMWPTLDGIDYSCPESEQFDGIGELTFATVADRQNWFNAATILMDDEYNIFSKAIGYNTSPGNSQTYVDGIPTGEPNGELRILKFHVMVKKADGVSVEAFRKYMTDSFAPAIAQSDSVLKFRLHLFEEVDNSRPDAPGVIHVEPQELQYQAAFEIAFSNPLDMANFFASPEYTSTVKSQPKYIKQINTFPERTAYTFVYDGQMTLAGQRSSTVAELITNIGAINQLKEEVASLMSGQVSLSNGKQDIKSDFSVSDAKVSSQTTMQKTNMLEKLPGTASDMVTRLFARGEAFDSEGFIEFFTDTPVYQFGNFAPCLTKAAIKQSVDAFFSQVFAVYHEIKMMWEVGDIVFVEMDVIYWRKDNSVITLPCCDIFRLEGDKFSELRIFMDANPVSDTNISVPNTSSVLTVSQGQRLTPPDIMKKYFTEHDEGKKRMVTGFAPKWSKISSK